MDALTYFLLNYGLYSLLLVVPAALLGVAYGWFRRGKYQAGVKEVRKRMEDAEGIAQEVEIALSKEREQFKLYRDFAEEGGTAPVAPPELDREMAALRRDNEELEKLLRAARAEREEAEGNLAALLEEKTRLSEGLAAREREKSGLEKELSAKAKAKSEEKVVVKGAPAGVPQAELKKFKAEKRELEKKLVALAREYRKKFAVQESPPTGRRGSWKRESRDWMPSSKASQPKRANCGTPRTSWRLNLRSNARRRRRSARNSAKCRPRTPGSRKSWVGSKRSATRN